MSDGIKQTLKDIRSRPVFGLVFTGAIISLFVWMLVSIFVSPPPRPWGSFPDGVAFHGELRGELVTRSIDENGRAIIDSENPQMHAVRCGPERPIEVVSTRFYFVGEDRENFARSEGGSVPFQFAPPPGGGRCGIVSFDTVPVDRALAGGHAIEFRLDIRSATGEFQTVVVRSESMVFGDPDEGTIDSIELTVPR